MRTLDCVGLLELPRDVWVRCDRGAGHEGKHSGWLDGRWSASTSMSSAVSG